jgi:hypothetical protein
VVALKPMETTNGLSRWEKNAPVRNDRLLHQRTGSNRQKGSNQLYLSVQKRGGTTLKMVNSPLSLFSLLTKRYVRSVR